MLANAGKSENDIKYAALPHVLVVDDDERICALVCRYLQERDFVVFSALSGFQAQEMLKRFSCDVIILDVMMPGQTGFEFARSLRKKSDIPIIFLTALGEIEDRIEGFKSGGDDYLPKPFEPEELIMRLHAILRRRPVQKTNEDKFRIGRWVYDPVQREIYDGAEIIKLTMVEDNLIKALSSRRGEVISREDLAALCDIDAGERTIDVQVTRLRRKIEEDSKNPRYLQTLRGKGYLLRVEDL
jgi:two-component system phosphate regulon response regulator OmpR